jgi:hypothetical protein
VARQRFVAPSREDVDPACFDAPIFAGFRRWEAWMRGHEWPQVTALDAAFGAPLHPHSGQALHFVAQEAGLLADGLHYEERIFAQGRIATRSENWHDLFNAVVWLRSPQVKAALNARQAADVARVGPATRTRAQCALTHFDEAGAILVLRDPGLLACWDAHDWDGLFRSEREAWRDGRARVIVIGHALLEHALAPSPVHTAKCLAVLDAEGRDEAAIEARVAAAIIAGEVLADPQELRPLPLSGVPGWHPDNAHASFYRDAPCFRPLRAGRTYPPPIPFPG